MATAKYETVRPLLNSGSGSCLFVEQDGGLVSGGPNLDLGALITHAAAGVGSNGADQTNYRCRGVNVVVDITALAGTTPTLTVTIEAKDSASGKYYTILQSAALNAVATTVLTVYPGIAAAANTSANAALPRTWRVRTTIGGSAGQAVTATVGASPIV